jgi:hypothetical protein
MQYYFRFFWIFVLTIVFIPICLAQGPYYSADGDTAYIGENAIVRNNSTSHITGPIPNSVNTITTTTWGEDMRLTHLAEIGGNVNAPRPFILEYFMGTYTTVTNIGDFYLVYKTYSYDNGSSWTIPDTIIVDSIGVSVISGVDTLLYFLGVRGYTFVNSIFMRSFNSGENWIDYHEFENLRVTYIGKSTLTAHGDSVFTTYYLSSRPNMDVDSILFSRSEDRGFSWSDTRGILYASNDMYFHWLRISLNRMHIIFQSFGLDSQEIFYSYSDDYGLSWIDPILISDDDSISSQWPFLSADEVGNLCVSWSDYKYGSGPSGFTGDLLYRISQNNGESWGGERRLTYDHLCTASRSIIDGDYLCFIWTDHYFGWLHANLSFKESFDGGNTWSDKYEITNNGPEYNIYGPEVLFNDNDIYLFWMDDRDSYLFNYEIYFKKGEVFATSISEDQIIPENFGISTVYPNPFNSSTVIDVICKHGEKINLSVYDIRGSKVKTLFEGFPSINRPSYIWNGTNQENNPVTSGVYFIRFESNDRNDVRKAVFLK